MHRLVLAINGSKLSKLCLHTCELGDEGGKTVVDLLQSPGSNQLRILNMQNNVIGFEACTELSNAAAARSPTLKINLDGNRVFG
jgi:hypothetical protein